MFRSKFNILMLLLLLAEMAWFASRLEQLTIFQYMFYIQILPTFLLALLLGQLAYQRKGRKAFIVLVIGSALFSFLLYQIMLITPQAVIEENTAKHSTELLQFNRDITLTTYLGFFLQEFLLSSFVLLIHHLYQRVKSTVLQTT